MASSGMSSCRSRSGGMLIGKTSQSIEEVAAELSLAHHQGQIAVCRGDHSHVYLDCFAAVYRLKLLLL